ncbi:MAG: hypothetical protein QM487_11040 [Candidatus Marithrix sp.]
MTNLLDKLRTRVHLNLDTIRTNELEVKQILKQPITSIRSKKLSNRFILSKQILEENKELLQIQYLIIDYLNQYKGFPDYSNEIEDLKRIEDEIDHKLKNNDNITESSHDEVSENEPKHFYRNTEEQDERTIAEKQAGSLFELTVSGELKFNKTHPEFYNSVFFDKLLTYYIQNEEYEKCAQLSKIRRN